MGQAMKKQILIIDDDAAIREMFVVVLGDAGYGVDTASTGEEGLVLKQKNKYDLLFLDFKMPGINGVETLQQIRKKDKKIPVYIITSFYGPQFDEIVKSNEGKLRFELLKKPIDPKTVVTLARNILEKAV